MPTERILSVCGGPLSSCSVEDVIRQQKLTRTSSISFLTPTSPVFVHVLLVLQRRSSPLHLSVVSCVFSTVTPYDVAAMVRALPEKQCSSDPLPMRLLKANIDILVPFVSHLFCWSLQHGAVPSLMKSA